MLDKSEKNIFYNVQRCTKRYVITILIFNVPILLFVYLFNLNGSILIIGYPIVLFVYLEGMFNFLFSVMTTVSLFFFYLFSILRYYVLYLFIVYSLHFYILLLFFFLFLKV